MYGSEAVLPAEVSLGSPRVRAYQEEDQDQQCQQDVLYLEEVRCRATLKAARYQQALHRHHSATYIGRFISWMPRMLFFVAP